MNCEVHEVEPLTLEPFQVKEVLKALLHSIIFQRALSECRHRDAESELFDLPYVCCESRPIAQKVEEFAEAFSSSLERGADTLRVQVGLAFFERRTRPAAFGLFRSEEKVVWERWSLPLAVRGADAQRDEMEAGTSAEQQRRQLELEEQLRHRLEFILEATSGKKEHIPPADGLGGETPWFEISSQSGDSWKSSLDVLKRVGELRFL